MNHVTKTDVRDETSCVREEKPDERSFLRGTEHLHALDHVRTTNSFNSSSPDAVSPDAADSPLRRANRIKIKRPSESKSRTLRVRLFFFFYDIFH